MQIEQNIEIVDLALYLKEFDALIIGDEPYYFGRIRDLQLMR